MQPTSTPGIYTFTSKDAACAHSGIKEGTVVVIDTNIQPSNNSLVCIRHNQHLFLRKILFLDADFIYVPDDPHHAVIESDLSELVGVVIKIM